MSRTDKPPGAPPDSMGARLRRARLARQMSQSTLAERSTLEQATISKIETGNHPRGEEETLRKLSEALSIPLAWLRSGTGELPADLRDAMIVEMAGERIRDLDWLIDRAYVPERHSPSGSSYLRHALLDNYREVFADGPVAELVEPARYWLDAVDLLREAGRPVTLTTILLRAARLPAVPAATKKTRREP